jgi:hypothetical protein
MIKIEAKNVSKKSLHVDESDAPTIERRDAKN